MEIAPDNRFWRERAAIFIAICVCYFPVLTGCSQGSGSRIAHYRKGGSYFGGGPSVSPDGKYILFSSPRTGNGDVFRVDIDGSNIQRITTHESCECDSECSHDGTMIAYVRETNGLGDIWIMNADGTGQRQLTTNRGDEGGPKFVPDGSQIVFWRTVSELESRLGSSRAREIFSIDVKTGLETRLTTNEKEDVFPSVSPNGENITFVRDGQLWIMNRKETAAKLIGSGWESAFSPDNTEIVAAAGSFSRQIDIFNVDGSKRRTVYLNNTRVSHPTYSPDGKAIIFLEETSPGGVGKVLILPLTERGKSIWPAR